MVTSTGSRAADQRAEAGRLQPVVATSFPFTRAGEAHRYLAERRNIGKVVLVVSPTGRSGCSRHSSPDHGSTMTAVPP